MRSKTSAAQQLIFSGNPYKIEVLFEGEVIGFFGQSVEDQEEWWTWNTGDTTQTVHDHGFLIWTEAYRMIGRATVNSAGALRLKIRDDFTVLEIHQMPDLPLHEALADTPILEVEEAKKHTEELNEVIEAPEPGVEPTIDPLTSAKATTPRAKIFDLQAKARAKRAAAEADAYQRRLAWRHPITWLRAKWREWFA